MGDLNSMYNVGVSYKKGYGVEKNDEKCIRWLVKAAKAGNENAKSALSRLGHSWEEQD